MLKGFEELKMPKQYRNRGSLTISIYKVKGKNKTYVFGISSGVIRKLGLPKTLKIMINKFESKLAILPNGEIKVKYNNDKTPSARICNANFMEIILKMMGKLKNKLKIIGEYIKEENAIIFCLNQRERV